MDKVKAVWATTVEWAKKVWGWVVAADQWGADKVSKYPRTAFAVGVAAVVVAVVR